MSIKRLFKHSLWALLSMMITGIILVTIVIIYFAVQLPDVDLLKDARLQVPLKIYTSDGKLIGVFGAERRNPITIDQVPKQLIQAILATEDQRFFDHIGVDPMGLMRASLELITTGQKRQGGSTITMQVARNYFLTSKKTYTRKIKEILLAIKIDHQFSKDKILELYLNKIYFGNRAYGIAAASQVYYGKPLKQLNLAQLAMLAGIPKAPSKLNPLADKKAAMERRNHVLQRMYEHNFIDKATYLKTIKQPLTATYHGERLSLDAPYIAEMVRDAMLAHFGEEAYTDGYRVYTTINSADQIAAQKALRRALLSYDKRHGYRGPVSYLVSKQANQALTRTELLTAVNDLPSYHYLRPAVVLQVFDHSVVALLGNGKEINIPWDGLTWAKKEIKGRAWGKAPEQAKDVVKLHDLIYVTKTNKGYWRLSQVPQVEGALVSLNPKDGAILALVGGYDYNKSNFNRVIQAQRQPGSAFKPFIYAAALAKGYTLASTINDAPVVVNDPSEETLWRPQNDSRKFYGPTRLRIGLIKSRNLVSIRLLQDIGPTYAINYVARFGFDPNRLPKSLSLALGSGVISPLELATGYSVFANGGYRVNPYIIARITNEDNDTVYQANPKQACEQCASLDDESSNPIAEPVRAPRVISAQVAYLMTQAMRDVIRHGTGRRALSLKRNDLAGKTGTTNEQVDAWFSGFNSNVVTTVWMGFDNPRSLYEYGAQAALPVWITYMSHALKGMPEQSMPEPPDIVSVRIDSKTGLLARQGQQHAIFELFRRKDVPTQLSPAEDMGLTDTDTANKQDLWQEPLY